ncbi:MAG: TetR/AcrR family transcriptional regulator [Eubacteriaceae bacterium]|nr:TetR/AcrR family transcriptional regulator [Eubacteriaceae bacterium]
MKGDSVKQDILDTARILFYEKGYTNTFLDSIAENCGITKPLILYYFTSKAALARAVKDVYIAEIKNVVSFKVYRYYFNMQSYDLQVSTAVEIRISNMLAILDENVSRFELERADDKFAEITSREKGDFYYEIHDRHYRLDIDRNADEIAMISTVASIGGFALARAYKQGHFNCTSEQILDYIVSLNFKLMHVPEERINEILAESKKIVDTVSFEIQPYFRVV